MADKPVLHRRDHEHGGADPVRIVWESTGEAGEGGGGIRFDTTPQAGTFLQITTSDWMNIETEGSDPLNIDANGTGDINLFSNGGDIAMGADGGVIIDGHGSNGVQLNADGDGDLVIEASGSDANSLILVAASSGGHLIILQGLPTSDPGVAGALWNDGGTLRIG